MLTQQLKLSRATKVNPSNMEPTSSLSYYLELQKQAHWSPLSQPGEDQAFQIKEEFEQNYTSLKYDPHKLFLESAEEMDFDLPESLFVERIGAAIKELGLGFLLLAGLFSLVGLFLLHLTFVS